MSYPPPQNGHYHPQYHQPHALHHHQQQLHQQQPPLQSSPQLQYNALPNGAPPYPYGKPVMQPQVMIPSFNTYPQTFPPPQQLPQQQQQHQQHPRLQPHPPLSQYVNPQVFQQAPPHISSPSNYAHGNSTAPRQYGGTPPTSNATNSQLPSVVPQTSASSQSSYYTASPQTPAPANTYGNYSPVTARAPPSNAAPQAFVNPQELQKSPVEPPRHLPRSQSQSQSRELKPQPQLLPQSQSQQQPQPQPQRHVTAAAASPLPASKPTPTPAPTPQRAIPQVLIPPLPPDVQKKIQHKSPKKSTPAVSSPSGPDNAKPPVDHQVLLLSLADEYLNAAHSQGTRVVLSTEERDVENYYKLIATGLGCLEAVLKNWRLPPRVEALVRLRYARVLYEETDNDLEAETALSKGIDLCERNRMLDLKYSMQQLLARMLYKSNRKAALKAVDGMIGDVEAYRHTAWEYAFRLLRVSLSLSSASHQDFVSALHHLHKINSLASRNGDKAVSVISAMIEALAHLQLSPNSDAIEQAQRCVAAARSHQLNDEIRNIPQLNTMIQMVDICCSLVEYDVNQSAQKLKVLQDMMDRNLNDEHWQSDGSFSIPLGGRSTGPSSVDTGHILHVEQGTLVLTFNWLHQADLYALCYFLSAVTLAAKNSFDGRKAEKFLDEGLRMIKGNFKSSEEVSESVTNAATRLEWRKTLYCNFLLQQVFLACARTDWDFALQTLTELRQAADDVGDALPPTVRSLMQYLSGTISQGNGDLVTALEAFQSPLLSLSSEMSKTTRNDPQRDIAILAALNTILILRDPHHASHDRLPHVLSSAEAFCRASPNKYIQAAYYLVCAMVQTESTLQTKQFLQQALQSATAIGNSQITCMSLTFMSWKYFRGVVGEQAEKSARAGRAMARRANDRLWISVTDDLLADMLETQGKGDEASVVREEGYRFMASLPPALKRHG